MRRRAAPPLPASAVYAHIPAAIRPALATLLVLTALLSPSAAAQETGGSPRKKEDIVFSADSMSGTAGKKNASAILRGNARVKVGELSVESDFMEISGDDYRFVNARGNVTGEDTEKGFSFSARSMEYDREKEISIFRGPLAFHDTENNVEISAGYLSYDRNTEIISLQIDIVLEKDDMVCSAAFAVYRRNQSMLELSGMPSVINEDNEFRADRIYVNLDTENITLDGSVSGNIKDTSAGDSENEEESPDNGEQEADYETAETGQSESEDGEKPENGEPQAEEAGQPEAHSASDGT